jgi:hypothetical protein
MKFNYIIITQPRSGDEILISKLRSHPNIYITLGNPIREYISNKESYCTFTEYLQYKYSVQNYKLKRDEQEIVHSLNTREHMETIYREYFDIALPIQKTKDDVKCFLDKVYSKNREEKEAGYLEATNYTLSQYKAHGMVVYMKDFLNSKNTIDSDLLSYVRDNNIKVIVLTRNNLLWRYVSSQLKLTVNDQGYSKIITETCTINEEDLRQDINACVDEQQSTINVLTQNNIPYHAVTYEQICDKTFEIFVQIQKFLNVPVMLTDLHGINIANIFEETRPLSVIVSNYNQLKDNNNDGCINLFLCDAEKRENPLYFKIREKGSVENLQFIEEMYKKEYFKMYNNIPAISI